MKPCEVAVVGAGIVGAATAWELHARGVDVALLDRGEVSGATTGLGEGNVLCSDKEVGPELELTLAGLRVYDELEALLGEQARIRRKGALIVHRARGDLGGRGRARGAPARRRACRAACSTSTTCARWSPSSRATLAGASFFPADLQCAPRAIARALAGGLPRVHTGVEVHGGRGRARPGDGRCARATARWRAARRSSPPARGAARWPRRPGVALPLEPRKGQLVRLAAATRDERFIRHKVVEAGYLGSVASVDAGLQVTTVLETTWEGDVLVGSSRERRGFDLSVDDAVSDAMLEQAFALMPGLRGARARRRMGRAAPVAARSPARHRAVGRRRRGCGWPPATRAPAWRSGPVTGRLVAQLYAGEAPVVDPAPFSPDRF